MRIILLQPYFDSHIVTPPLGLGYLASSLLARNRYDVEIIDCNAWSIKPSLLLNILKVKNPDLIGVTILTNFFTEAKDIILKIKELTSVKVVVGGPHVTALPEFTLQETNADFAIVGEGEQSIVELTEFLESKNKDISSINGLVYKENGRIIRNSSKKLVEDINNLPFPAWELLRPQNYPPAPHGAFYKRFPVSPIITTRGCPYSCKFCSSFLTWGNTIRKRTPNSVVDEIQYLKEKHNIKEFHFEDDNFTISKEHAISICEEIIRRKLNIAWAAPNGVRIDALDDELIRIMKLSGCYLLAFGIESGSQSILDKMNKKLNLKNTMSILKLVKKHNIETWGFFIIGLPNETRETVKETIRLSRILPLDRAQFCNFVPLPGTDIFNDWIKDKSLSDLEWKNLSFSGDAVFRTKELSEEELTLLQKVAFRSFYFRPKILFRTLLKMKPRQIKWILRRIKAYSYLRRK